MQSERRAFIKKSCMAGLCFCGAGSLTVLSAADKTDDSKKETIHSKWITSLLVALKDENPETARTIIKKRAEAHFNDLNLKETLSPFKGKLELFHNFLSTEWGWKISYDKSTGVIIADENKSYCVCPLIQDKKIEGLGALCYCSEGMAELMFSYVTGKPVKSELVQSVLRGAKTCIYKIIL